MTYIHLIKPRSVLLLLLTALAGMVMAGPELPPLHLLALTLLGGALAAGGANTLNCYLDRDLDARMGRTSNRPLPSGTLAPNRALISGLLLSSVAVALLALEVNWLAALLALAGILYYVVIYTIWLKRRSAWNVVIGGGAGGLPILVGWAAATGELSVWPLWLGAIVVLWTMPHFWSLALVRRGEYALAGLPMLPVVLGEGKTRERILHSSVALFVVTILLAPAGFASGGFLISALVLGSVMVFLAFQLIHQASDRAARLLYRYSIAYLTLLFIFMIVDRVSWLASTAGAA